MTARTGKTESVGNILVLPRASNRSSEISAALPACPVCGASAFQGEWHSIFDPHHACDCILEHAERYEAGVGRLWERRIRHGRYVETLPARYREYTFDTLEFTDGNAEALEVGMDLEPGRTLYLWGNPGNGKTHLACAIGFRGVERTTVVFWNMAALYARLRECIAHDLPRPNLTAPGVLILDDLGKVKTSEFVYETLYACLEARWSNARTTILTANHKPGVVADRLTPASLDREASDAILSRLVAGHVVAVAGEDRREGRG
jgi:DNA replication protein DnaC